MLLHYKRWSEKRENKQTNDVWNCWFDFHIPIRCKCDLIFFSPIFCIIHWFSISTNNRHVIEWSVSFVFFLQKTAARIMYLYFIHAVKMAFIYSSELWIKSGYAHSRILAHSLTHTSTHLDFGTFPTTPEKCDTWLRISSPKMLWLSIG